MLKINNIKCEITSKKVFIGTINKSGINGYNLGIQIEFINNNHKGYISIDTGYEKDNNINSFIGKTYINDIHTFYEIYDEYYIGEGLDSFIKIKEIKDNKINISFILKDELITIEYDGYIEIDYNSTRETFMS